MIQVCSQCGTRWNVRDKQRSWCPRCGGTLLAPAAQTSHWVPKAAPTQPSGRAPQPTSRPSAPKLAPGFRWIAVRPGTPPARRQRRPLGPTPHYQVIPSWGLEQYFGPDEQTAPESTGPAPATVRRVLTLTMVALTFAAFAHVVRYVLLLINRKVLLHPVVAYGGVGLGLVASVLALVSVIVTAVILTNWLIARRASAYRHRGQDDPRSAWEILFLSLFPGLNVMFAPVFVVELASVEGRTRQLRRPIVVWWVLWALSAVTACWSVVSTVLVTFVWPSPQGIADNTVATTVAYLFALAVVAVTARLFNSFAATEAHHSAHRWVVVAADAPAGDEQADASGESAVPVEPASENPAA